MNHANKKALSEFDRLMNIVIRCFGEEIFNTKEFINAFSEFFPSEYNEIVHKYGIGGSGAGSHYTSNSYFAQQLDKKARENVIIKEEYASPDFDGWGSGLIRQWAASPSNNTTQHIDETPNTDVIEGAINDRNILFRARNAGIIKKRKALDDYTCQSCGFKLDIDGIFVIECHHINPLSTSDESRVTHIDELVCLCPTCHRIAHSSKPPLCVDIIQEILKKSRIM